MNPLLNDLVYKKGRSTTEFGVSIVGIILTGAVSLGLIDLSPESITEVSTNVVAGAGQVAGMIDQGESVMAVLFRIIALIVGGHIVTTYIKSRSETKNAKRLELAREIMIELETLKQLKKEKDSHVEKNERTDEPNVFV